MHTNENLIFDKKEKRKIQPRLQLYGLIYMVKTIQRNEMSAIPKSYLFV